MKLSSIIKTAVAALTSILTTTQVGAMQVIHQEKSLYRNIVVYEEDGQRCLSFSRKNASTRQSCRALDNPQQFVFDYTKMMMAALYLNPQPQHVLIIGLGGGILPQALTALFPDAHIEVVEIDPAVVKVAEEFFGFNTQGKVRVFAEDGRVFIKRTAQTKQRYDLIMLDAFDHEYIPEHLLTKEFLLEVKALLTADGVLAANTFSSSRLYHHESVTYSAVFGDFYNLRIELKNRIILKKMDGFPSAETLENNAGLLEDKLQPFGFGRELLLPLFSTERDWNPKVRILTDQYSPSNLLNSLF